MPYQHVPSKKALISSMQCTDCLRIINWNASNLIGTVNMTENRSSQQFHFEVRSRGQGAASINRIIQTGCNEWFKNKADTYLRNCNNPKTASVNEHKQGRKAEHKGCCKISRLTLDMKSSWESCGASFPLYIGTIVDWAFAYRAFQKKLSPK